jgi:protoporphyrinogen oxidase
VSEEVKPLFKNDILNGLTWETPDVMRLYEIFGALRGPDLPLKSAECFKEAFTWRVRAAFFKEFEDKEWEIKVRRSLEHGLVSLFSEISVRRIIEPYIEGYLHYLSHLIFAFKSLAMLSLDKNQKKFYRTLARVTEELFDYVRTQYPKKHFNAISLALKNGLTDTEKLSETLYSHSPEVVEAFVSEWKKHMGAEFPNISEKGEKQ